MKKTSVCLIALFMLSCLALPAEDFTVKEVPAKELAALTDAQKELDSATAAFAKAQAAMRSAEERRNGAMRQITGEYAPFEGTCGSTVYAVNTVAPIPTRKSRRVEIRGRYALISDVSEPCWVSGALLTDTNGTITAGSLSLSNGSSLRT